MKTIRLFLMICLAALLFTPAALQAEDKKPRIGVSLPTTQQERWIRDEEAIRSIARKKQLDILVEMGNNNQMQQNLQIGRLLSQNIDVLILAPHDAVGAASMVRKAHNQGVKVISYDRLVLDPGVDVYITFDNEKVGELQALYLTEKAPRGDYIVLSGSPNDNNARLFRGGAMKVIEPLVEAGMVKIAADTPVIDWMPENAQKTVEKLLADGVRPVAVLAPNDSTAGGVIEALAAHGLAGKVPVSGQDADLEGARRIVEGLQSMTVFKDTRQLAAKAIDVAVEIFEKESWEDSVNARTATPDGKNEIPTILLEPVMVDKSNLQKILVDSQYLKQSEVFVE
ncbi:ATPase [Deltaproteobacteria bacterium Smac51]|nr:ATPase [Deltaproteobacteria bacterium Smac51]